MQTQKNTGGSATATQTLAEVASNNPNFSSFLNAIKAADLLNTLKGAGPYTVFIPNNDAFAKLPQNTWKELLKPENKEKLKTILTFHFLTSKLPSSALKTSKQRTVNGKEVNITAEGGKIKINNATVTKSDIQGSNGVIYVIDTVLMP